MTGALGRVARLPAMRAVGVNTALSAVAATVGFGANILMTRALGPTPRGQVAFVLQAAYVVAPLIMLGVDRAALRADSSRLDAPRTRHVVPMAVGTCLVLLAAFRDARAVAAVVALATCWLAIQRSEALRDDGFASYARRFLVYQGIVAVGIVVLYATGETRWYAWLAPYLVPAVLVLGYEARRALRRPRRPLFGAVTRTSLGLLPASLASIVVMRAERVLMPALASNAQLGLYVAVATATEPAYWIAQALADHRSGRATDRRFAGLLRRLARDLLLFVPVAAVLGVGVWALVVPVFGEEYADSRAFVLPLSLAVVVLAVYRQAVAWHLSGPAPEDVSRIEVITAVVAVACYAVGIHLAGALGAAWATLGVYAAGLVVALILAARRSRGPA